MTANHRDLLRLAQISLLQDENDVFQPALLHEGQEIPGRLRPGIDHRKNKEHQIGTGHELLGDALVLGDHGIGAGSIDDVEVAQEIDWQKTLHQLR